MKIIDTIKFYLKIIGIDLFAMKNAIRGFPFYLRDRSKIIRQKGSDNSFPFGKRFPILGDRFTESGTMKGHYFHQDLYVARKIYNKNPVNHIDIGSRTDGFVAHVAVFRKIEIIDIRNQVSKIDNIIFRRADLMQLPQDMINSYESISSLHAIEHFGLGRYGDPIDYAGHIKAIQNITAMLKIGGTFYFAVPIGAQRIEFNAHRVFSVKYLLELFEKNYKLVSFAYVDDNGDLFENTEIDATSLNNNFNCNYGCGIFELTKIN
jgi:hypothetical protein